MNNAIDKFLPLGTVITLKGSSKKLMITGYCVRNEEDSNTSMFDYSGCLYPKGIQKILFDHGQIEKIYYLGFVDEDARMFKSELLSISNRLNQEVEVNNNPVSSIGQVSPVVSENPVSPIAQVAPVVSENPVSPIAQVAPVVSENPVSSIAQVAPVASENPVSPIAQVAPVTSENPEQPSLNIKFDENGFVISD